MPMCSPLNASMCAMPAYDSCFFVSFLIADGSPNKIAMKKVFTSGFKLELSRKFLRSRCIFLEYEIILLLCPVLR